MNWFYGTDIIQKQMRMIPDAFERIDRDIEGLIHVFDFQKVVGLCKPVRHLDNGPIHFQLPDQDSEVLAQLSKEEDAKLGFVPEGSVVSGGLVIERHGAPAITVVTDQRGRDRYVCQSHFDRWKKA
jgi:hypothetical protein